MGFMWLILRAIVMQAKFTELEKSSPTETDKEKKSTHQEVSDWVSI